MTAVLFTILTLFSLLQEKSSSKQITSCFVTNRQRAQIASLRQGTDSILSSGFYFIVNTSTGYKRRLEKSTEEYFIHPIAIIPAKNFKSIEFFTAKDDHGGLLFKFNEKGTLIWLRATEMAYRQSSRLALIVDNRLLWAPFVHDKVTNGEAAFNGKDYSQQELQSIKQIVEKEMTR